MIIISDTKRSHEPTRHPHQSGKLLSCVCSAVSQMYSAEVAVLSVLMRSIVCKYPQGKPLFKLLKVCAYLLIPQTPPQQPPRPSALAPATVRKGVHCAVTVVELLINAGTFNK